VSRLNRVEEGEFVRYVVSAEYLIRLVLADWGERGLMCVCVFRVCDHDGR
jgi:hypothetical protein